jgi:hypothetical protein
MSSSAGPASVSSAGDYGPKNWRGRARTATAALSNFPTARYLIDAQIFDAPTVTALCSPVTIQTTPTGIDDTNEPGPGVPLGLASNS